MKILMRILGFLNPIHNIRTLFTSKKSVKLAKLSNFAVQRRSAVAGLIVMCVLLYTLSSLAYAFVDKINRPDPMKYTRALVYDQSDARSIEELLRYQNFGKEFMKHAVSRFTGDATVDSMLVMLEEKAFYSIPAGPEMTRVIMRDHDEKTPKMIDDTTCFEVVFMPPGLMNHQISSVVTIDRTIRIGCTFASREWAGIVLAHELSHVVDKLRGEDPSDRAQYLAGEVRAHRFENRLVRSMNPVVYEYVLSKGVSILPDNIQEMSDKDLDDVLALIESYYLDPSCKMGQKEKNLIDGSLSIAILFEWGKEHQYHTDADYAALYEWWTQRIR